MNKLLIETPVPLQR